MRRRIIILFMLAAFQICMSAHAKKALVVFIGSYPECSGWRSISSANDRAIILAMLEANGFSPSDVVCLEDAQATYEGIGEAFSALAASLSPGDDVYIHFSCHGQQITDLDCDERLSDPTDLYDEAIVPYDACRRPSGAYSGERHLTDDVLNEYMNSVRKAVGAKGCVLLVVDACHSGDVQRGEEDSEKDEEDGFVKRGTSGRFDIPGARLSLRTSERKEDWVTISACRDFESNYECQVGGVSYGRLSYAMSRSLRPGIRIEDLLRSNSDVYGGLPGPYNRYQHMDSSVPQSYKGRRLFR